MALFASEMFPDHATARAFTLEVEKLLRGGKVDEAEREMVSAVAALVAAGHPLAALCQAAAPETITLSGWDRLAGRFARLDRPGKPISAFGIDLSDHGDDRPDDNGYVEPFLETSFYSDAAFPFSIADRATLLSGYEGDGWAGRFEDIDGTIEVHGLGALNAGLLGLHALCQDRGGGTALDHDARLIGATLQALRLHQAVLGAVRQQGLPRAVAVMVGSNESFPYFDAPVIAAPDCEEAGIVRDEITSHDDAPGYPEGERTLSGPALRRSLHGDAPVAPPFDQQPVAPRMSLLGRLLKRNRAA